MAVYTAIDDPEAYFQVVTYTGDGADDHAITLPGDTDMQPDAVWVKVRDNTDAHEIYDSVRGAQKRLTINTNAAEGTQSNGVMSFDSDGFTVDDFNSGNNPDNLIVAWCWKESATSGFDIVSYTGTGSAKTESHSLSAVPHFIIVKNRDALDSWQVYHHKNTAAPETDYLLLDTTAATADAADRWNDTAPTSSVFSLGDGNEVNTNTEDYIAYCFAEKQGFSKFGSYTGNGNADGPFIFTGFRPAFVLQKITNTTSSWHLHDNKRGPFNPDLNVLYADKNNAEGDDILCDFLSNGFKIRATAASRNGDGNSYIYVAFAEAPFVNSNGVPCNAR